MFGVEKSLNEITFVLAIVTMICAILHKRGIVNKGTIIFLCILTVLVYLCSRTVNNNNSRLSDKDKDSLNKIKEDMLKKKGKK